MAYPSRMGANSEHRLDQAAVRWLVSNKSAACPRCARIAVSRFSSDSASALDVALGRAWKATRNLLRLSTSEVQCWLTCPQHQPATRCADTPAQRDPERSCDYSIISSA